MGKAQLKLFGKNVLLRQERKGGSAIRLHLPDNVKQGAEALFDMVVDRVGDKVTRVKPGDVVYARTPAACAVPNPDDPKAKPMMLITEDMIQGVFTEGE